MTIGAVFAEVAPVIGIAVPESVYGSTDENHVALAALANEMAQRIAQAHDWQVLRRLQTYTGNGDDDAWPLPSDYDRMPVDQDIWSSTINAPMSQVNSANTWLGDLVRDDVGVSDRWHIVGDELVFNPVLEDGETAQFYFISNLIVADADSVTKAAFTVDTDSFRINERLLKLGIIWQWRAYKGVPYAEDMQNYEFALAQRIGRERGARKFAVGRYRYPRGVRVAYPRPLGQ